MIRSKNDVGGKGDLRATIYCEVDRIITPFIDIESCPVKECAYGLSRDIQVDVP